MRITIFCIVLFIALSSNANIPVNNDTIKIKEVVIRTNRGNAEPAGYKQATIDTTVLYDYRNSNLSDMLLENTNIFVKSYGMGGIATPAFRGTGASHTIIAWNGININSPMLGQSDLSLIPVGFIDDIKILYGGASMFLNSGGLGGTINLETKPVWKKETSISMNTGIGSFGQYSALIKVKTGNDKIQTVTKGFYMYAENNFRFLNNVISREPVWQIRTNSQVRQQGLEQEVYYHIGKNLVSARLWYLSSDRNLPSTMLTQQQGSNEKQFDESLRTMFTYDIPGRTGSLSFTGAWLMNRLNYYNKLAAINSQNLAHSLTLKADFKKAVGANSQIKILLDEVSDAVKSNNYTNNKTRSTTTLTASVERKTPRLGATILLREIMDRNQFLIPDFSTGLQFRLINEKDYFINASISRNSKIPTMNDLYWAPGGNPGLKNEYSLSSEFTYSMNQKFSANLLFKFETTVFYNLIKDMILWHPGEYAFWTADNISNVRSSGVESTLSAYYTNNSINSVFKAGYSFTKSVGEGSNFENDVSAGKQLLYIPENQANASLRVGYKSIYTTWLACFVGRRYTTSDNSEYLTGYFINNLNAGIKFALKRSSFDINFRVDNIFNVTYQSIAYYPLPGRSYNLTLLVQIAK